MKQTAVEFLEEKFKNSHANFINWSCEYFEQAKERENQQVYSEEEVLKSADNLGFKQITSEELNSLQYQPFITDENGNIWIIDKENWFEQFK